MPGPAQLLMSRELHVDALTAVQGIITIITHTIALTARCPHCQ
jgi:hypothetical protein